MNEGHFRYSRKQRIFLGTIEIAGAMAALADGFRQSGDQVTTAIRMGDPFIRN